MWNLVSPLWYEGKWSHYKPFRSALGSGAESGNVWPFYLPSYTRGSLSSHSLWCQDNPKKKKKKNGPFLSACCPTIIPRKRNIARGVWKLKIIIVTIKLWLYTFYSSFWKKNNIFYLWSFELDTTFSLT